MEKAKHNRTEHDLTVGSPAKKILLFSLPLILTNVLQVLFSMSDLAVVGRFSSNGAEAIGAIGSTTIYVALFTGILIGIGSGINALAARHIGAENDVKVTKISHTGFIVSLIFGLIIFGLGAGLARPILRLLGTKSEFIDDAAIYIYIYFSGLPGLSVYNYGNGILSADGDTKRPLIFLSAAGVLNIGLNILFVVACDLSVAGVAVASVISQYVSAVLTVIALCITKRPYGLSIKQMKAGACEVREILALGLPAGLQNAIFSAANLFIQAGVNTFDAKMVEGNSVAANADNFVYNVMCAFYIACTSFVAQNYGAGKHKNILKCYLICLAYSFGIAAILGVIFVLCGRPFLSIFTSDAEVIAGGMKRLSIMGYSFGLSAFMDCTISASRGMGKTLIPTIIVILGSCVFRIVWVYTVFEHYKTIPSLYLLYTVSWTMTAVAEIAYFVFVYVRKGKMEAAAVSVAERGERGAEAQQAGETECATTVCGEIGSETKAEYEQAID